MHQKEAKVRECRTRGDSLHSKRVLKKFIHGTLLHWGIGNMYNNAIPLFTFKRGELEPQQLFYTLINLNMGIEDFNSTV